MKKGIRIFAVLLLAMVTSALKARTLRITNKNTSQRVYVSQIKSAGDEGIFDKPSIEILKGTSRDWPAVTNKAFTLHFNYKQGPSYELFVDNGDRNVVIEVSYNGARRQ